MSQYLVHFSATLDANSTEYGIIRVSGIYDSNVTKWAIEKYYREKRLSEHHVAVVITAKNEVTSEEYNAAANNCIDTI